jgi:hemolysin activation/secretion protein
LLLLDTSASARREDAGLRNAVLYSGARYYHRNLGQHLFSASLSTTISQRLDVETQVLLGGDNDLRGYPLRYQSGERSAVLTLEQRFFTDWYPFRLLRVGYAVFFDAGRVWGEDPRGTRSQGMLYDLGVGLRISSPRSSGRSVVHVDLAFPLNGDRSIDDVQLIVEKKASF